MADHSRSTARRAVRGMGSTRVRAVASLGIVLGLGAVSTMAYWTDTATVTGGTFSSGNLDLKVGGQDDLTFSGFTADDFAPGESFAASFTVKNAGTTPFTYTAKGTGSGTLASRLQYTVRTGGTAGNSGSATNGNRVGTCGAAGTAQASDQVLGATAVSLTPAAQTLVKDQTQEFCVIVRLDPNAPNPAPGAAKLTGSATFVLTANQLVTP